MKIGKLIKKIWNVQINNYSVKNESNLKRNLERLNRWYCLDIEKEINHEKAHYDKAKELHYFPEYGVRITKKTFLGIKLNPLIQPCVKIKEDIPSEDKIKIALAPLQPSTEDYSHYIGIPSRGLF